MRTPTLFVGNNPLQLAQAGFPEAQDVQHWRLAALIMQPVSNVTMLSEHRELRGCPDLSRRALGL